MTIEAQPQACCGNCRFSQPARDNQNKIDWRRRFCRWGPPTPVLLPTTQGPVINNLWPTLHTTDTCGRHEFALVESALPGETKPEPAAVQ